MAFNVLDIGWLIKATIHKCHSIRDVAAGCIGSWHLAVREDCGSGHWACGPGHWTCMVSVTGRVWSRSLDVCGPGHWTCVISVTGRVWSRSLDVCDPGQNLRP